MGEWFDDDNFWVTFERYMFSRERIEGARAEVDRMIELLGIPSGGHVLDLCCGTGRHSLEFARRGFVVTGVDRTRSYIEKGRAAATSEGLTTEFVEMDMREFVRPNGFDAAINFFTAFGYFEDADDDLKVASNLCASLSPGGRLLIDVMGKELIAARFRERTWNQHGDTIVLEEGRILDGWKRIETRWIMIRGTERRESKLSVRLYSGGELEAVLLKAGFAKVELLGKLSGEPYDRNAERLIAVATRS